MKIQKTETRGRKPKIPGEKIIRGLTKKQWNGLEGVARQYGVPVAYVHRQAVDWFLSAIARESGFAMTKEEDKAFEELTS